MKPFISIFIIIVVLVLGWVLVRNRPAPSSPTLQNNQMTTTTTTPASDQLKVETLKQGSGVAAKTGDTVSVKYTGTLQNGTVFDSNVDPKFGHTEPFEFLLG